MIVDLLSPLIHQSRFVLGYWESFLYVSNQVLRKLLQVGEVLFYLIFWVNTSTLAVNPIELFHYNPDEYNPNHHNHRN